MRTAAAHGLCLGLLFGFAWPVWGESPKAGANAVPNAPGELVIRAGDQSVVMHWRHEAGAVGYRVYRSGSRNGPWTLLADRAGTEANCTDFSVTNGGEYYYVVRAVTGQGVEGAGSTPVRASPRAFADDEAFLDYVQQTAFDYFWYEANPANGLVRDRSKPDSPCSIAAVGFGLTGIGIGIERGWISRERGRQRVLTTLRTFWNGPQGTNAVGVMGHRGWFYHFVDMNTGGRVWKCELSSIDTALLLAGALTAREFFDGADPAEGEIRRLATALYERVDWEWMCNGGESLTMGWHPESGFIRARWIGYNEAMILYLMALGAAGDPLPAAQWSSWTSGYKWRTHYGQSFVEFPPLFGHQYSHCWVDFREMLDPFMKARKLSYFENSRRATIAQREYCIANPGGFAGYGSNVWGLTACDGPGFGKFAGYRARGAPPAESDDGTIAPTAAGGSLPFAPEVCLPTLRHMYSEYRTNIWCAYGFRDAFNLTARWWDPDVIGIDQGPILIMAENYRSQSIWRRFMRIPEIQRGLKAAGFSPLGH